jgi:hypothetical protein
VILVTESLDACDVPMKPKPPAQGGLPLLVC